MNKINVSSPYNGVITYVCGTVTFGNRDNNTYYLVPSSISDVNNEHTGDLYNAISFDDYINKKQLPQTNKIRMVPNVDIISKTGVFKKIQLILHGGVSDYTGYLYELYNVATADVYVDDYKVTKPRNNSDEKQGAYCMYFIDGGYIKWLKTEVDNNFGITAYENLLTAHKKYEEDMVVYNDYIDKKKKYAQYIIDKNNYETYQLKKEDYDNKMIQYDNDKKEYDEYLVKKQKYDKYMSDLQIYNSVMDTYNKKLEQYNKDMEQYKKDLEEYNKTHNS